MVLPRTMMKNEDFTRNNRDGLGFILSKYSYKLIYDRVLLLASDILCTSSIGFKHRYLFWIGLWTKTQMEILGPIKGRVLQHGFKICTPKGHIILFTIPYYFYNFLMRKNQEIFSCTILMQKN